jgi:hypothetical protein
MVNNRVNNTVRYTTPVTAAIEMSSAGYSSQRLWQQCGNSVATVWQQSGNSVATQTGSRQTCGLGSIDKSCACDAWLLTLT